MTTSLTASPIILIAGHWLGAWAWDDVLAHLQPELDRTLALTLPGLDPRDPARATKNLDDQVEAIFEAYDRLGVSADQPVTIVAHSGANFPVSLALDSHPERVHRVVWVDSGPVAPRSVFAPDLPVGIPEMPLPAFEALGQYASLDGLTSDALDQFRQRAVPQPGPVLRQPVELTNDARLRVPTTLVCSSNLSAQVLELAHAGHPMFAEVARLESFEVVDLPTGHWPMWSRPNELARIIQSCS